MPHPTPLATFAAAPLPLYSTRDAAELGVRMRHDGNLIAVRHGVYAEADLWSALRPWERYLARVHAFILRHHDAALCLESAAAVRGLPLFGEPRDIHIYDAQRTSSYRFGDVAVHTSGDDWDLERVHGVWTTSPPLTALHLMRVLPPAFALSVADAVVRSGTTDAARLRALADSQVARRGERTLRWLWPRVDGRSESVGESVSRAVIEWCGFIRPELQTTFSWEGAEDRVDFFWPTVRSAGESDGYGKYLGGSVAVTQKALVDEKRREDRLRRHLDGFARWDWADTMNPKRLATKLTQAGIPLVAPPQDAFLRTLRTNPRSR